MPRWICPRCDRQFERANQAHDCAPGITVKELLSRHPAWVREIYQEIISHLRSLGPIHEDAVDVGIFLKSDRKIAEFRPKVRSAQLSLFLPDARDNPLVLRSVRTGADRIVHIIKLTSAEEVDDELLSWLTESYDLNTDLDRAP
jgi:uncharacterized protein DUF5655